MFIEITNEAMARWLRMLDGQTVTYSCNEKIKFGKVFLVSNKLMNSITGFLLMSSNMLDRIRLKELFINIGMFIPHKKLKEKIQFYQQFISVFDSSPAHNVKFILRDFMTKSTNKKNLCQPSDVIVIS